MYMLEFQILLKILQHFHSSYSANNRQKMEEL